MSWKFWQKDEPETRGYHDSFLNALVAQAEGSVSGSPLGLAALEMAAGSYARCFASASITPDTPVTRALTPSIRAHIGRDMIRQGGALLVISVRMAWSNCRPLVIGLCWAGGMKGTGDTPAISMEQARRRPCIYRHKVYVICAIVLMRCALGFL